MAFDFSLTRDPLTPIRNQTRLDSLFSPSNIVTPTKIINDLTYQVPSCPKTTFDGHLDDMTLDLPDNVENHFPRQSTGIKSSKPTQALEETAANEVSETIPQYRPLYQMRDTLPTRATCFHPLGEAFVVGTNSKTLSICLYPTEEELKEFGCDDPIMEPPVAFQFLQIHRGSVYCAGFNDLGNLLATGSNDQTVHVIKYNSKKHLPEGNEFKLTMHTGTVRDLCFINTGGEQESPYLVTAGAGKNEIYITDCKAMKPVRALHGHESTVMSLYRWDDSHTFVSGSLDGTIRFWDTRSKLCLSTIGTNKPSGNQTNGGEQGRAPVGVVRIEPSGKLLVSGHSDGRCMLYDIRGGRVIQLFKAHEDEIRTLNFSPKTYYLLTGGYDHKVKLMDIQGDLTNKLPSVEIAELDDKVVQTAWHPDDYTFVTTSADGSTTLWAMPESAATTGAAHDLTALKFDRSMYE